MKLWLLTAAALIVLSVPADARSRCQYFNDGREPLCWTTQDGGYDPYIDGRDRQDFSWHRRMEDMRRREQMRRDAEDEGRSQWRNDGFRTNSGILVSPFVPGSNQDRAWHDERRRRGIE